MNRFGSNNFENENDQYAENQRIGRQLAENNPRPWSGGNNPYNWPDNRHHHHPNYRPDSPVDYRYENQRRYNQGSYNQGSYNQGGGENPVMPYFPADDPARHHDDHIWTERNFYKDQDYRYRSGHRNYWHEDYDDKYEEGRHPHRRHPESFFTHVAEGIRDGWNNLFHRSHYRSPHEIQEEERRADERRRREHENRIRRQDPDWHNDGPDHRDEDFFNPKNFRL